MRDETLRRIRRWKQAILAASLAALGVFWLAAARHAVGVTARLARPASVTPPASGFTSGGFGLQPTTAPPVTATTLS
jgi:hypothetical protein